MASEARAWLRRVVPGLLDGPPRPHLLDDAELLLGELAANALQHAGGVDRVAVCCTSRVLHIVVHDPAPVRPWRPPAADAASERGRGTVLFGKLAVDWGVSTGPDDGKDVWLDVPL
ncbi:ATP-binding protein [Dactylosporangium siamense]|uniref:ATP-binding protein n=1 Tax=Dactylosporangium siamense TaxID=685454 RepID=UPI0031E88ECD